MMTFLNVKEYLSCAHKPGSFSFVKSSSSLPPSFCPAQSQSSLHGSSAPKADPGPLFGKQFRLFFKQPLRLRYYMLGKFISYVY